MAFERYFSEDNIRKLQEEPLYRDRLRKDIVEKKRKGSVFPAVRMGRIDFYHRGGKLFTYDGKVFRTHHKYAAVLNSSKDYVTEADLKDAPPIGSFLPSYPRIKENCAVYAGDEAASVSHLYSRFSCARKSQKEEIVALDIEVSFENRDEDEPDANRKRSRQDRIDILLYNTSERRLRFFEAKLFSNVEIRASGEAKPRVVCQMERYRAQLKRREEQILEQYKNYVNVMNALFGTGLPQPESLDLEPKLYVFGFDKDQRSGRLAKDLACLRRHKVLVYAKGRPESVEADKLWARAE